MTEHNHNLAITPGQALPHYAVLEQELASLGAQEEALNIEAARVEAMFDEPTLEALSGEMERIFTTIQTAGDSDPDTDLDTLIATSTIPEDAKPFTRDYVALGLRTDTIRDELEEQAAEKRADVAIDVLALESQLDWDAVAQRLVGNDNTLAYQVGILIRSRKLVMGTSPLTYQQLKMIEHGVQSYADNFRSAGLLTAEAPDASAILEADSQAQVQLREVTAGIEAQLDRIEPMLQRYRLGSSDEAVRDIRRSLHPFKRYAKSMSGNDLTFKNLMYGNDHSSNLLLVNAMQRQLAVVADNMPAMDTIVDRSDPRYAAFVEEARAIDPHEAVQAIEISGDMSELPFAYDEAAVRELLIGKVPPIALRNIKRIEFRPLTPEEDEKDNTNGFCEFSKELNGHVIVISTRQPNKRYEENKAAFSLDKELMADPDGFAAGVSRRRMEQTVVHEAGHVLHRSLPVADLEAWAAICEADPTRITAYVKSRFDEKHPHKYMEDFADPMAYFATKPFILSAISRPRYEAMMELYQTYMPQGIDNIRAIALYDALASIAIEGGLDAANAKARRFYLAHERDDEPQPDGFKIEIDTV